jgi:hypothetical protein
MRGAGMDSEEFWQGVEQKRAEVFEKACLELHSALNAFELAVNKTNIDGQLSGPKRLYSEWRKAIARKYMYGGGEADLTPEEWKSFVGSVLSNFEHIQGVLKIDYDFALNVDFQESLAPVYELHTIMYSIWGFLIFPFLQKNFPGMGPGLDLAREKALYACGKMVAMLEQAGRNASDGQSIRGKKLSNKHVGHDAVHKAFYLVEWEGLKSITPISAAIRGYLLEVEKAKPEHKRKVVYSEKQVRSILPKDEKIKSILIAEGILKA